MTPSGSPWVEVTSPGGPDLRHWLHDVMTAGMVAQGLAGLGRQIRLCCGHASRLDMRGSLIPALCGICDSGQCLTRCKAGWLQMQDIPTSLCVRLLCSTATHPLFSLRGK